MFYIKTETRLDYEIPTSRRSIIIVFFSCSPPPQESLQLKFGVSGLPRGIHKGDIPVFLPKWLVSYIYLFNM